MSTLFSSPETPCRVATSPEAQAVPTDSLAPERLRGLESDWSKAYTDSDFNYHRTQAETGNYLSRFLEWISRWMEKTFGVELSTETLNLLEVIIYGLLGVLAIYLLVRYISNAPFSHIFRKEAQKIEPTRWMESDLKIVDLDALLRDALGNGDYRLAIRYRYLKLLQRLAASGRIDYHVEKTNWDYLQELGDRELRASFAEASRIYEYIWYGEQGISESGYRAVAHFFESSQQTSSGIHG